MSLAHNFEHQLTLVHPVKQSIGGSVRIVNCSPLRIPVEYQLREYLASKHIKPNTIHPQPHPTRMSPSVPKSGSQILTLHRLGNPANRSPIGNPIPHPQNVEMVQQNAMRSRSPGLTQLLKFQVQTRRHSVLARNPSLIGFA